MKFGVLKKSIAISKVAMLSTLMGLIPLSSVAQSVGEGCEVKTTKSELLTLIKEGEALKPPLEYDFTGNPNAENPGPAILNVQYEEMQVAGCQTRLRQWSSPLRDKYKDNRPIGPTMRILPGKTYSAQITNKLPEEDSNTKAMKSAGKMPHHLEGAGHGGESTVMGYIPPIDPEKNLNVPHNFNVTNLHTHGWHVDPNGISDNIFRSIMPGGPSAVAEEQVVHLPEGHPSGTFWYHAHLHGSTTLQVGSGMSGALIVNSDKQGLGKIKAIQNATDKLMVFQQLAYGKDGQIEDYTNLLQGDPNRKTVDNEIIGKAIGYENLNRPVFVNGQAYPKVAIQAGELQRWRFVHAGITDGINPQLVRMDLDTMEVKEIISMYEISLDGLPTGTMPEIQYSVLNPGFRSDVLVRLDPSKFAASETLFLVDQNQSPTTKITLVSGKPQETVTNFRYILAQINVTPGSELAPLPTEPEIARALQSYQIGNPYKGQAPLKNLTPEELDNGKNQHVRYLVSTDMYCPEHGGSCVSCNNNTTCNPEKHRFFMVCEGKGVDGDDMCFNFNPAASYARLLSINSANRWFVTGNTFNKGNHIFHIHVNPFQVQRKFIYGDNFNYGDSGVTGEDWVWKDTIRTPNNGVVAELRTRYTMFTGAFVQHCHVLSHEDNGMMQVVSIEPTLEFLMQKSPELHEAIKKFGEIK